MIQLTVEFLGLSRKLAGRRESQLQLVDTADFRGVLRQLATVFPALIGPIIVPPTYDLAPSYLINIDGRRVVRSLDARPQDGQRLIFMFMEAGG